MSSHSPLKRFESFYCIILMHNQLPQIICDTKDEMLQKDSKRYAVINTVIVSNLLSNVYNDIFAHIDSNQHKDPRLILKIVDKHNSIYCDKRCQQHHGITPPSLRGKGLKTFVKISKFL